VSERGRRRMTVTSLEAVKSGTSDKGKDWTLYDVGALDEAGDPIDAKLKTFDGTLPIGDLVELDVTKQTHEQYGDSYLLERPGSGRGGGLKGSVDDLRERVERLESQVKQLLEERS
jgi:hypothetical protein